MNTIGKAFLATVGVAIGLVVLIAIASAVASPSLRAAVQAPPAAIARPVPTPEPQTFSMDVTGCGWPNRGGVQVGRTFHIVIRNVSVSSLPLNPLYFTVETPDRHVVRAGVLPYDLNQTALQLIELRPGQTADGWIFFDLAPIELQTLIFDDHMGQTQSLNLADYTLTDKKTTCGAKTGVS